MQEMKDKLTENDLIKDMTLSQIVTKNFNAAKILEKYDLDFCCGGNKKFDEACSDKGINAETILEELINQNENFSSGDLRFDDWELDFLVDYILNNHHLYVRENIPVISAHAEKVIIAHGKNHSELMEVSKLFSMISKELTQHMIKEEQILFPYIKNMAKVKKELTIYEAPYFGKISNPIKMMEVEHETAGNVLFDIRRLTNNYLLPDDACNTYSVFYKELKMFEEDLHKHIHLENNILFPKSIKLEEDLINIEK